MYSPITGTGDGSAPVVNITFDFIAKADVKARVAGVDVAFTWTGASQITFSTAVTAGAAWEVYRATPIENAAVDFTNGSVLTEQDLDLSAKQIRFHQQEVDATFGGLADDIAGTIRAPSGETMAALGNASARANRYVVFDASGDPTLSLGTGTDAGLRGDLAAPATGPGLIGVKNSLFAGTVAGTLQARYDRFVDVEDFGVKTTNTAAQNATALLAMINVIGGGTAPVAVMVPSRVYPMNQVAPTVGNFHLIMHGATFTGPTASLITGPAAADVHIYGGRIIRTDAVANSDTDPILHLNGPRNRVFNTWIEKAPEGGGYMVMMERTDATSGYNELNGLRIRGGNGIFVEGPGHRLLNLDGIGRAVGADDFIVLKARGSATRGILIDNIRLDGYSNAVAFGSEIGTLGANDATRAGRVQNVRATNIVAKGSSFLFYFKPGAIDAGPSYDWRDGLIDTVYLEGQIEDVTGAKMERPLVVSASRGAKLSNVTIKMKVVGRSRTGVTGRSSVYDVYVPDYSAATPPAAPPTITDVHIEGHFHDPYDGVANGVGGAPGDPFDYVLSVEKQNIAHGTISKITAKVRGNGSDLSGVYVGASLDDVVELQEVRLSNVNRSGGATNHGGVFSGSRLIMSDRAASINVIGGRPYQWGSAGEIVAELDQSFYSPQINAGNAETHYPWSPRRRAMLLKVDMMVTSTITQNDTNYTEFEMRNMGGSGNVFHSPKTKVTSGGESAPAVSLVAGTRVTLLNSKNITDVTNGGQLLFPKDSLLFMRKQEGGTGATVLGGRVWFSWAPY